VTLFDKDDGKQELNLLFRENGKTECYVVSFDKDGKINIKDSRIK
jgi:hypothetical protein